MRLLFNFKNGVENFFTFITSLKSVANKGTYHTLARASSVRSYRPFRKSGTGNGILLTLSFFRHSQIFICRSRKCLFLLLLSAYYFKNLKNKNNITQRDV